MSDSGSLVKMMRTSSSSKHGSGAPKREGQERRHESSAHRDARHQRSSRRYHSKDGKNVDEKRDRRKDHDSRSRSGRYDGDRNNLPREHGPRWMTLDDRDTDDYFASDENQKSGDKTSFPGTSKQRTRRFSHHSHESSRKSSNYKSSSHRSSKLSSSVTVPAHSQSGPSSTIQAPPSMILPKKSLKKDNAEFEVQEIEMSDGENGSESNDNVSSQDPADYPSDDGSKNSSISSHSSSQVGSEEEEISESEDKLPEPVEEKPESDIMQEPSSVGEKMDDSQPVGKEEETEPDWPIYDPAIQGCRSVDEFERLNKIEEGAYGVVYRAREKRTGTTVALKRVKMEKEKEGFPITSLREINTLLKAQHPNIVTVKEIVVGNNIDSIYIVMEYVEHDLKGLMSQMQRNFKMGEVKTLMLQLLAAVEFLHDHWIIHRDLKTSNLLLNHKGILKVGDFGLAREYGSPLKPYTPVVVTLWYRAPELLLQAKKYSTAIDMWSVGCIFGEFLTGKPLFAGKSEIEQLKIVYEALGSPNEILWPGYSSLPFVEKIAQLNFPTYHYNNLKNRLGQLSNLGINLITHFLSYCPERRITASKALLHDFFTESPKPIHSSMFPTWPAKSEAMDRAYKSKSPKPPSGGKLFSKQLAGDDDEKMIGPRPAEQPKSSGFRLRF